MKVDIYRRFYDPIEANIVATKLQAANIECFLTNELTTNLMWHLNIAHGGVNLMLRTDDFVKADLILQDTEHMKIEELDNESVRCPRCNSNNVKYGATSGKINWWQLIAILFIGGPAPITVNGYHCFNCEKNFDAEEAHPLPNL